MICNLKLFFTISKKKPTQSPKPNTISGILYSGHCIRHQAMAKILGFFKRVKNKNIICVNNFSKK